VFWEGYLLEALLLVEQFAIVWISFGQFPHNFYSPDKSVGHLPPNNGQAPYFLPRDAVHKATMPSQDVRL